MWNLKFRGEYILWKLKQPNLCIVRTTKSVFYFLSIKHCVLPSTFSQPCWQVGMGVVEADGESSPLSCFVSSSYKTSFPSPFIIIGQYQMSEYGKKHHQGRFWFGANHWPGEAKEADARTKLGWFGRHVLRCCLVISHMPGGSSEAMSWCTESILIWFQANLCRPWNWAAKVEKAWTGQIWGVAAIWALLQMLLRDH